jgi:hypothetical protein
MSKKYWECDSKGRYVCLTTQTCCQSKILSTGWACFNLIDAVCCNDNMSACPHGYACNVTQKTCDRKLEFFLEGSDAQCTLFTEGFEPKDTWALYEGFMEGLAVFDNLPHSEQCNDKALEPIEAQVNDSIDIVRSIEFNTEGLAKVAQLVTKLKDLYDSFEKVAGPCREYAAELQGVMLKVISRVESASYLTQLPVHLLMELSNLKTKAFSASDAFSKGDYKTAGKGFGDLVHLALLWEF